MNELKNMLNQEKLAFTYGKSDLGKIGGYRFTLPLKDADKIIYNAPRPIPPALQEKVKTEFKKWTDVDMVQESHSDYNIPTLIVRKSDGSVRIALDCRSLNQNSIIDRWPLPSLETTMYNVSKSITKGKDCYISMVDLSRAYLQLPLYEKDRGKLAFSFLGKHWESLRLIYGVASGPASFTRCMNKIFGHIKNLYIFVDDVICINGTWEDHMATLQEFFQTCIKFGLTVDPGKTNLIVNEVTFLGETVNKKGRKPSDRHIQALNNYPEPENRQQLKRYLGMCSFVQKHVHPDALSNVLRKHMLILTH